MGHALEIRTNSADVLSIASNLWAEFPYLEQSAPVQLTVEVYDGHTARRLPSIQCEESVITITQGTENFGVANLNAGTGVIRVGADLPHNAPWFAYHFLEPIAYALLGVRHFTMLHAACVAHENSAVLLCGASGAGKTCLAYACAKRGWSFVTGDAAHLVRRVVSPTIIGRPFSIRFRSSAKRIFPELARYRASARPNGKRDLELDPRNLGIQIALQARPSLIVFLNRVAIIGKPVAEPVSIDEARNLLSEWICLGDSRLRSEQRAALERLLETPAVRMTFSDPFAAEELLRSKISAAQAASAANGSRTQKHAPRCAPFSTHRSPP
ncbi:MAG TPA: hypothetical protein VK419_03505 [Bryobacteraceae bacterium]|nr:hypothetical protein [Bryobacteraceae bacterium]